MSSSSSSSSALAAGIRSAIAREQAAPLADFLDAVKNVLHALLALPTQASGIASRIDDLHYFQFVVFWTIGLFILGATGWFLVRYRRRVPDGVVVRTRKITAPLWLEGGFVLSLLAFFVVAWVIGFRQYVEATTPPDNTMDVYVTGQQWVWKFAYADGPTSAGVLYVPLDRPVRLILTSRDVIHSFFVPAFRLKRDAVPGRFTTMWFRATKPGRYQLLCAEYCGMGHSRMWGEVVVLESARFEAWLEGGDLDVGQPPGEPTTMGPDMAGPRGEQSLAERGVRIAAEHGCLNCHTTDGAPHIAPTWRGLFGSAVPLASGDTIMATPAYLTESMMDPRAKRVAGFPPIMPTFRGQLDPGEVAALLEYMRSIRRPAGTVPPPRTGTAVLPEPRRASPDTTMRDNAARDTAVRDTIGRRERDSSPQPERESP